MGSPFDTSSAYNELAQRWDLINDLLSGTLQMRARGETWLPREPEEELAKYTIRLSRSVLFDAFKDTVRRLSNKPFTKKIEIEGTLPEPLAFFATEVNRAGQSLTAFGSRGFFQGAAYGACYIMVDSPRLQNPVNEKEAGEKKIRPYLRLIHPKAVIAKVYSHDETGLKYLKEVRIKETRVSEGAGYQEESKDIVTVIRTNLRTTTYTKFQQASEKGADPIELSSQTLEIPFIPLFQTSFDEDEEDWPKPPLEGLAWLNLCHYQSMSDQRNILRIARCGLLFLSGLSQDDVKKPITFGPNYVFKTTNKDADGKFIEYEGASIEAGERDLKDLETRMELLGLAPLLQKSARVAATSRAIDEDKSHSAVQAWAGRLAESLRQAISAAKYFFSAPFEVPEFKVKIFTNFGISLYTQTELEAISKARISGDLTRQAFLEELKQRGVLSEDMDSATEAAAAEKEWNEKMSREKPADPAPSK